jgi:HK97 gp10 family phage protein
MAKSGIKWKTTSFTKQALKKLNQKQEKAGKQVVQFVVGKAKRLAPVDNGELRQSIDGETEGAKNTIGTDKKYGIYVEKGTGVHAEDGKGRATPWFYEDSKGEGHFTSGQKPQPYLTPAAEDNTTQITKIVAKVYSEITGEDN